MKVTLEGSQAQILDAFGIIEKNPHRRGVGKARERTAIRQRRILREAYDLVRDDEAEAATRRSLARAMGGRNPITATLLESAQQIIAERANAS